MSAYDEGYNAARVKRAKQQQRRHRRRMAFARIIHRVKP